MQNSQGNINEKYIAQGFVESLIAVAITGLAGVLLLSVSMSTIDQTLDNEAYDEVTNGSANLRNKLSYLVDVHNFGSVLEEDPISVMLGLEGSCFDLGRKFVADITISDIVGVCPFVISDGKIDREACELSDQTGVFNFVCVNANSNESILSVDLISGDIHCTQDDCKDFVDKEVYLLR